MHNKLFIHLIIEINPKYCSNRTNHQNLACGKILTVTVIVTRFAGYIEPQHFYVKCILGFTNGHTVFRVLSGSGLPSRKGI